MREVQSSRQDLLTVVLVHGAAGQPATAAGEFIDRFSQRLFALSEFSGPDRPGKLGRSFSVKGLWKSQLSASGLMRSRQTGSGLKGPTWMVTPTAAQRHAWRCMSLSTNALKYGSLSGPVGTVLVDWVTTEDGKFNLRSGRTEKGLRPTGQSFLNTRALDNRH